MVEMRCAPAIVCIGDGMYLPYIIYCSMILMIYSCFGGESNKRSDVSQMY